LSIRLSNYLKERFGEKVYRLSLSSGCTCPNRDGKLGFGGCTFCSEGGSGEFAAETAPIGTQIEEAKKRIASKTDAGRYIAYFQSFTNTYGDIRALKALYLETIRRDDIAVLSLGTRPDCLGDEVMDMLSELKNIKPVWIELGLQTIHERTADYIRRGYPLTVYDQAVQELRARDIEVITHVILGLPGETEQDMLATVDYVGKSGVQGIKLQLLHVIEGTDLAEEYRQGVFSCMTLEEYVDLVC